MIIPTSQNFQITPVGTNGFITKTLSKVSNIFHFERYHIHEDTNKIIKDGPKGQKNHLMFVTHKKLTMI